MKNIEEETTDNAIYLDYSDYKFTINIIDDNFTDYEKIALKHNQITIYFKNFELVNLMMINIQSCNETSDMPFAINDFKDTNLIASLNDDHSYTFVINYVDSNQKIIATRTFTATNVFSNYLKECLKAKLDLVYDEKIFNAQLQQVYSQYEPFEIEDLCEKEGILKN